LPAIRVKGRIAREVSGSANPNDRVLREGAKAGRQHACTFGTFDFIRSLKRAYRLQEPGADFPPMTAGVQTSSRPARTALILSMAATDGAGY